MKKTVIAIIVLAIVGLGGWALVSKTDILSTSNNSGGSVAIVNGEEISREDFDTLEAELLSRQEVGEDGEVNSETREEVRNSTLNTLISQTLLRQKTLQAQVEVDSSLVDAQIEAIKNQFGEESLYNQALATQGVSEVELISRIKDDISMQLYLEQELNLTSVTVTEEEITTFYEQLGPGEESPELEEIHDDIEGFLTQQKRETLIEGFLNELRQEAEVEILI